MPKLVNDVLIVGGGPAGTATALGLLKVGLQPVVIERTCYDDLRVGETVPPSIRPELSTLDLWDVFAGDGHLPGTGNVSIWGDETPQRTDFFFSTWGPGWHLDRARFDRLLAQQVTARGGSLLHSTRLISADPRPDGWQVEVCREGVLRSFGARVLVDASGRSATVLRRLGGRRQCLDRLVGVVTRWRPEKGHQVIQPTLLVEATETGWWYSAPLPCGQIAAAFLSDPAITRQLRNKERLTHFLAKSPATRERLSCCRLSQLPFLRAADSSWATHPSLPSKLVLVGDAALAFDPLSSRGILEALRGGIAAANAILRHLGGQADALSDYHHSLTNLLGSYRLQRTDYYRLETRWPSSPFWRQRHKSGPQAISGAS